MSLRFALFFGFSGISLAAGAATQAQKPSFRDISIDLRCAALSAFIGKFAESHLYAQGFREVGCSEGNGIGGATYELEFKLKGAPDVRAYTVQISMNEPAVPQISLCMQTTRETLCSKKFSTPPANGEAHFAQTGKSADVVNQNYGQISPLLPNLLPEVVAWVASEQKFNRIFGTDFSAFVGSMLNKPITVPVSAQGETNYLQLQLTGNPSGSVEGSVRIMSDLPADAQTCLGCGDKQCKNYDLSYRFNHRFLAISGKPHDQPAGDDSSKVGLAWVMEGPEPVAKGAPVWRFFCGISRYSVQVIRN
jgi:hypothetical protein